MEDEGVPVEKMPGGKAAIVMALAFLAIPMFVFTLLSVGLVAAVLAAPFQRWQRSPPATDWTALAFGWLGVIPVTWFLWVVGIRLVATLRGRHVEHLLAAKVLPYVGILLGALLTLGPLGAFLIGPLPTRAWTSPALGLTFIGFGYAQLAKRSARARSSNVP